MLYVSGACRPCPLKAVSIRGIIGSVASCIDSVSRFCGGGCHTTKVTITPVSCFGRVLYPGMVSPRGASSSGAGTRATRGVVVTAYPIPAACSMGTTDGLFVASGLCGSVS